MRFFLISGDGDGCGIARRLVDEGHDVTVQIKNPKARSDYDGLLKKTDKLETEKGTIVLFDSTGGGKTAERLRGQGFDVLGASMFAQQLEMDRHLALELMADSGIQVPPSQHFTDWDAGRQYIETVGERLCYKSDDNGGTSYVASGPEDMLEYLRHAEKEGEKPDFELQQFVKGLEISSEIWFDGIDWVPPANHTFEKKQLMNDDIGPSSGCAGNVVWACTQTYCRICEEGVKQFIPMLRQQGYRGPIDLNTIVNAEGVWGLEWTPRFGFDAFPALMEMMTEPLGETLEKYARGERQVKFPLREKGFGAALRVTIPPYPFDRKSETLAPKGIAIRELVRADRNHAYFYNVLLDDEGKLRSSGAFGAIAAFTGFGDTVFDAMGKCEEIAKRVDLKEKQFRTDLGERFSRSYQEFQQIAAVQPMSSPLSEPVAPATVNTLVVVSG